MSQNRIALQNKFLGHGQTIYDELARRHDQQGYIADADIDQLAEQFHLPPAQIRTTAKFYEQLSADQPTTHTVKICNGEACRAAGMEACEQTFREKAPKDVRVEHVTCLGYCGRGPNAMVDGQPVHADIEPILKHLQTQSPLTLTEPINAVYPPPANLPCVLMRHFDQDVASLEAALAAGIYEPWHKARTQMTPEEVLEQIQASQLRGRGGAGFPIGTKLQTVAQAATPKTFRETFGGGGSEEVEDSQGKTSGGETSGGGGSGGRRFVVVNCDEGDAGAYIDKELCERDPHTQLASLLIAAYACGAKEAYFYVRFEYPRALKILQQAIDNARAAGLLETCEVTIVKGQGAYICGEETALLRSIEGLPAIVSYKPPFPAVEGLWGCPTAVNNVETIHNLSWIIEHGGKAYAALGHGKTRGTKAVSLNTRVHRPGMYEVEAGMTLREIIFDLAGGMADGHTFKAVQVGGPLGGIFPEHLLDTPLTFEDMAAAGGLMGHAGIVVYSQEDDLMQLARHLMHFCAVESCGKCFPCRIGAVRGTELFDQMLTSEKGGGVTDQRLALLDDLCETMKYGSLCALGGMIPIPIENLLKFFPQEVERYRL